MAETEPVQLPSPQPAFVPLSEQYIEGDHPTDNPDGVTVSNVDYTPKTQEEKAALLHVEMVETVETAPEEPYPDGDPMTEGERDKYLQNLHTPQELVPADRVDEVNTANLAAGGSKEITDGTV